MPSAFWARSRPTTKPAEPRRAARTITEQLVKNVYLSNERTMARRLSTTMIALQLERKLSKDEILEAYLNEIYYGNRAYGAQAAAKVYFGKHAKDLTIAESALMAGLPQSPTKLDPFKNYDNAKARQRLVLHEMFEKKRINWGQYQEALKDQDTQKLVERQYKVLKEKRANPEKWESPYFVSYVREYLRKNYGYDLNEPGLKVYTSLEPKLQKVAEESPGSGRALAWGEVAGRSGLARSQNRPGHRHGRPGADYYDKKMNGQFNRAVQGKRQPGSTMKPYIYAAAMEAGYKPDSRIVDSSLWVCGNGECPPNKRSEKRGGHEVKNYEGRGVHYGATTLERALGKSNNVRRHPSDAQSRHSDRHPESAFGWASNPRSLPTRRWRWASPMSRCSNTFSAYGAFATKGLRVEPTPVVKVENYNGEVLLEQPDPPRPVARFEQGRRRQDVIRCYAMW